MADEPVKRPYGGYPDWREWLTENIEQFQNGRIKANNPSFYSFLISKKLLPEAKNYLISKGYVIQKRTVAQKRSGPRRFPASREEFVEKINDVRIFKGEPLLEIIDKEEEVPVKGLDRIVEEEE